jgi:uncharacterized repeat protein (TIGR03809 family)
MAPPEQIPQCMPIELTRKWRALAEKRRDHFIELYDSGRWRHYYTEAELLARTREAVHLAETWARLAADPAERRPLAVEWPRRAASMAIEPRRRRAVL